MNPIRQLASQTAVYGLSSIIGRFLNYLLVPLYTRYFVPSAYGVVTEMYAYITFFIVIFTYGMETAFFRFSETAEGKDKVYGTAFTSVILSSVLLMAAGIVAAPGLAALIDHPDHPEYVVWLVLILGLDAVSAIPFARLRQQRKALKFALVRLLNIFINIGLNLFFIVLCPWLLLHSDTPWVLDLVHNVYDPGMGVGYIFLSNLAASALTLPLLIPEIFGFRFGFDRALWKRMVRYALPLLIVGLAGMVNETLDRVLLKYLLPDKSTSLTQLGIYGACYKLAILMTLFIQAFRFAAEPFFFAQAKNERSGKVYADIMHYFTIVCLFIFLGVMLFIDIVKHFIDESYFSGLAVVPILLLANMFLGIYINVSIWYKLADKTKTGAMLSIGGALVTIVLNVWWIPLFGYMGSAWATLACYFLMAAVCYAMGQRQYPVPYRVRPFLVLLGVALGIYFLSVWATPWLQGFPNVFRYTVNALLLGLFGVPVLILERRKKIVTSPSNSAL